MNLKNRFFSAEFIRFGIVGVFNTLHHYLWFFVFGVFLNYDFANVFAFIISMIGSFYLNCYFTYKVRPTFKKFIKFPLVYLVQIIMAYLIPKIGVEIFNVKEIFVPLLTSFSIPVVFLLSRYILKKEEKKIMKL
ncbi:GtrA family protein [Paenibacillus chitinolyticus]|uniref:GtrA family protein n=1 Tax=Paenibacillus chitinolyticus TaxID=79263 RepID=A0A410WRY3_9BACL|nr:GtrA family protein [Paenibacillus chitinolyticus]MCY9592013.1 GtrA family protein [Paenibacillus chitinolyticus]MCY9598890.1 GtrA family protein [Paenibacillus chitinolyticus]QAV17091.1 GtrA family protein [Paenibacillus chitinolyticus]